MEENEAMKLTVYAEAIKKLMDLLPDSSDLKDSKAINSPNSKSARDTMVELEQLGKDYSFILLIY